MGPWGCVVWDPPKTDAPTRAHGRTERTTKFCTARARPIAARAPTAHYGGGGVFEVAFLKGSLWGVLSILRRISWGVIWRFRYQHRVSFENWDYSPWRLIMGGVARGWRTGARARAAQGPCRRIGFWGVPHNAPPWRHAASMKMHKTVNSFWGVRERV